ncbi:hypothetical protein FQN54_002607 [Arachnomyces sp. PD_36]|nr:hypothetical protein FQN54_002607 [Arachnomyces sp. PD_36]
MAGSQHAASAWPARTRHEVPPHPESDRVLSTPGTVIPNQPLNRMESVPEPSNSVHISNAHEIPRAQAQTPPSVAGDDEPQRLSAKQDRGLFQCGYCKKNYNRADHLIRHVRSHTREKPYVCPICSKGFARPDLVKRHTAGHQQSVTGDGKPPTQGQSGRVSQACKACASSKLKCEEEKPCKRCRTKNIQCEYAPPESHGGFVPAASQYTLEAPTSGTNDSEDVEMQEGNATYPNTGVSTPVPTPQVPLPEAAVHSESKVNLLENAAAKQGRVSAFPNDSNNVGSMGLIENYFPTFVQDMAVPPDEHFSSMGNSTYIYPSPQYIRGFMDYGMETNLELNDRDFGHLHDFKQESAVLQDMLANGSGTSDQLEDANPEPRNLAIGAEAFKKSSITDWTPSHQNSSFEEQGDLSLPRDAFIQATRLVSGRILVTERLTLSARDRILGMVLETCVPANRSRIVESYPSTEILDGLVQCFCHWHSKQLDNWVHIPTLNPNTIVTEALAMMIVAGAVRTPIVAVQKLGFAMVESVRSSFFRRFDESSATTRHLLFLQAQVIKLQVGSWSGNKRICEIAESLVMVAVTMLRRSRKFRRTSYYPIVPKPEDEGEELEKKWRNWIKQESFKRLVCRLYIHDKQASMAFSTTPLVSYAEFSAPLPMSKDLWLANTASRWKDIYLSKPHSPYERIPSLADLLQDTSQLAIYTDKVDVQLAGLVILHAIYALIWEHSQLNRIARNREGYWSGVILDSRQQEINHALQQFRAQFSECRTTPEVKLGLEVVSMHLYMCLEELQLYAGKEDKEEARRAYFSLRQWANSPASRRAVSHAGQVIRAAKDFEADTLRDFAAIAVYHASLAFWCYGVVLQAQRADIHPKQPPLEHQTLVFLDDNETPEQHTYISFGSGRPGIRGLNGPVWLEDTPGIMEAVRDILLSNYRNGPPAPLAMNLMQLMDDLGKAVRVGSGQ